MDSHGRVFYIDHATRTTSWTRPGGSTSTNQETVTGAEQHRRQLDRRYQSIRRTISSNRIENFELESSAAPGCKLLTRPDFFTVLHMNQVIFNFFLSFHVGLTFDVVNLAISINCFLFQVLVFALNKSCRSYSSSSFSIRFSFQFLNNARWIFRGFSSQHLVVSKKSVFLPVLAQFCYVNTPKAREKIVEKLYAPI